ncbi:MAG TPA: hypothetical protein PKC28_01225 [Bdellovibrionales bacterium]|nr:hypothetical protein [Bdellovibrionales bacterium]
MVQIFIALAFALTAQAAEKFAPDPENVMTKKDVVTFSVPWIKDKGAKWDFQLNVHNENPEKGMIVFLSDISCKRGKVVGVVKHTFFNTGERTMDFKPNERKEFKLVCRTEGAERGDFVLSVRKVYDNPSMDGKTVGKSVAENLTWNQNDKRE